MAHKTAGRQPVQIPAALVERLRLFSDSTGIPIATITEKALEMWLQNVGAGILDAVLDKQDAAARKHSKK
jgi:predicted DNA-binding protein